MLFLVGFILVATMTLLLVGLCFIWWAGKTVTLIYSGIGVLIFGFWIVVDTQLMMGGNHRYSRNFIYFTLDRIGGKT